MTTDTARTAAADTPPDGSTDRRSVEERRQQLVEAARKVMSEQGLDKATTRAITDEAGLALGAFHYAFISKDELLEAVIERIAGEVDAVLVRTLEAAETRSAEPDGHALVVEVLRRFLTDLWEYCTSTPELHLAQYELTLHALRDPSLRHLAQRQYDLYSATVARALGGLSDELDAGTADALARYVVATLDGLLLQWLVEGDDAAAGLRLARHLRTLPAIVTVHGEPLE